MVSDATGNYLAGLADGEGCFVICRKWQPGGTVTFSTAFQVALRADDAPLLRGLRNELDMDALRIKRATLKSRPVCVWAISAKADCAALVDLFDRFPLRSKKARDYAIWRQAVVLRIETPRGVKQRGRADWARLSELHDAIRAVRTFDPAIAVLD